jgi:arylsulfatase A
MGDPDRRSFLAGLGATLGGLAVSPDHALEVRGSTRTSAPRPGLQPNVIIMICDDLGYADIGCYGSKLNTPNLDRLASEGVRFTRYNTPHPICSASRAALLTGRYSTRTGTQSVYLPESTDGLNLDEMTLADVLHRNHYRSMSIGKWHLGSPPQYLPTSRGFDSYFCVPYSVDMSPLPMIRDKQVIEKNTDRSLLTLRYAEEAVRFIESTSHDPFFLYLAFSYPHIPINASPRFKGKSKKGIYVDAVEEIDWAVGQVLACLQRNHLDENTLVLFTSDHGPIFQGNAGPLRGRKGTNYEGGCRVPLLARWKNILPSGRVVDGWASHLDIMPTIAAVCGAAPPPKPLDGINILDLFTGRRESVEHDALLYFSVFNNQNDLQCVRIDDWKLRISQYGPSRDFGDVVGGQLVAGETLMLVVPELYNLDFDPGENYDLASSHPEIVSQLLQEIDRAIQTFPEQVAQAYRELQKRPASPATPEDAPHAFPASYVPIAHHYDGDPK